MVKRTTIGSVSRAMLLLRVLAATPPDRRRPGVLSEAGGIGLATTYHLLNTFEADGILSRDVEGCYQFGPAFDALAVANNERRRPPLQVVTALRNLTNETGETSYFSIFNQGKIEIMAQVHGENAVHVSNLDVRFSGVEHARASGKLFLAYLPSSVDYLIPDGKPLEQLTKHTVTDRDQLKIQMEEIRATGVAIEEGEFVEGVACVAGPVRAFGNLYGAITLTVPMQEMGLRRPHLIEAVVRAAEGLGAALNPVEP